MDSFGSDSFNVVDWINNSIGSTIMQSNSNMKGKNAPTINDGMEEEVSQTRYDMIC